MSGQIFLEAAEISVSEVNGQVLVAIVRSGDTSQPVTVQYATTNVTAGASDYTTVAGTITIPAGQTRVAVPVQILNDMLSEATETFTFSIINISSGQLLFPRTSNVSILDDENPVTDPPEPPLTSDYNVQQVPVVTTGLTQPMAFEFLPGNSNLMITAEKSGLLQIYNYTTGARVGTLLDITAETNNTNDRGVLDIALHPNLAANPYLYIFHTVDPPEAASRTGAAGRDGTGNRYNQLVRYTLDEATGYTSVVPNSKVVVLGGAGQSYANVSGGGAVDSTSNLTQAESGRTANGGYVQNYLKMDSLSHAGGAIEFGPDGALYVSTGDGTSYNATDPRTASVQNINSLSGKILRIDPLTGQGFSDNPFATADLNSNASKVYQLGLRNPFSMSFDAAGKLLITDTGWNSWEEVNSGGPGANFGWPWFEGGDNGTLARTNGYSGLAAAQPFYDAVTRGEITVTPAYRAFSHATNAPGYQVQAITGSNDLIDSSLYPDSLQGFYIFTDVSQGEVFAVSSDDRRQLEFLFRDPDNFAPVSFKQGPDGAMYYADLVSGTIGRLVISEAGAPAMRADYFNIPATTATLDTINFNATPAFTEQVRLIDQSTESAFYAGGPSDDFAVRYTGTFNAATAGNYTFFLNSDDGSELFIDGVRVVDNDGLHAPTLVSQTIALTAGQHSLEVRYFERGGGALVDLEWSGPGFARRQMLFEQTANAVNGTPGADVLAGTPGSDRMDGRGGGDLFLTSAGNDVIIGSPTDYDQIDYDGAASDFTITQNPDGSLNISGPGTGTDTASGIDGFWFRGEARWYAIGDVVQSSGQTINGTPGNDRLSGTRGNDTMRGNGGSDVFNSSLGNDRIEGNTPAYDQVDYPGARTDYTFTRNADGSVTVAGTPTGTDTLINIDGIWFGGAGQWFALSDLITAAGTTITGTSGNDRLSGTSGNDIMIGNGGSDIFNTSLGNDDIRGNAAAYDQVDYEGAAANYTFTLNANGTITATGALTGTDTLTSIEGLWFRGESRWYDVSSLATAGTGVNVVNGTSGADTLRGTAGRDEMRGNGGGDLFLTSPGDDAIIGTNGVYDQADYDGALANYALTRNANGTVTLSGGNTGTDTLTSIEGFWFRDEARWYSLDEALAARGAAAAEQPPAFGLTDTGV